MEPLRRIAGGAVCSGIAIAADFDPGMSAILLNEDPSAGTTPTALDELVPGSEALATRVVSPASALRRANGDSMQPA